MSIHWYITHYYVVFTVYTPWHISVHGLYTRCVCTCVGIKIVRGLYNECYFSYWYIFSPKCTWMHEWGIIQLAFGYINWKIRFCFEVLHLWTIFCGILRGFILREVVKWSSFLYKYGGTPSRVRRLWLLFSGAAQRVIALWFFGLDFVSKLVFLWESGKMYYCIILSRHILFLVSCFSDCVYCDVTWLSEFRVSTVEIDSISSLSFSIHDFRRKRSCIFWSEMRMSMMRRGAHIINAQSTR